MINDTREYFFIQIHVNSSIFHAGYKYISRENLRNVKSFEIFFRDVINISHSITFPKSQRFRLTTTQ